MSQEIYSCAMQSACSRAQRAITRQEEQDRFHLAGLGIPVEVAKSMWLSKLGPMCGVSTLDKLVGFGAPIGSHWLTNSPTISCSNFKPTTPPSILKLLRTFDRCFHDTPYHRGRFEAADLVNCHRLGAPGSACHPLKALGHTLRHLKHTGLRSDQAREGAPTSSPGALRLIDAR